MPHQHYSHINPISTRNGQLQDLPMLQQLFTETITSICRPDYNKEQIAVWVSGIENTDRWESILTHQYVRVAEDEKIIVGFSTLDKGDYIDLFYVHKDYQRQGIARRLYLEMEQEARRQGRSSLSAHVSKTAKPFFEKMGFRVQKEQKVTLKGVELINYKMMKMID